MKQEVDKVAYLLVNISCFRFDATAKGRFSFMLESEIFNKYSTPAYEKMAMKLEL